MIVNGFTATTDNYLQVIGSFRVPHHLHHPDNITGMRARDRYSIYYGLGTMLPAIPNLDLMGNLSVLRPHYAYRRNGEVREWCLESNASPLDSVRTWELNDNLEQTDFDIKLAQGIMDGLGIEHNPKNEAFFINTNQPNNREGEEYTHICVDTRTDTLVTHKGLGDLLNMGLATVSSNGVVTQCDHVDHLVSYSNLLMRGEEVTTLIIPDGVIHKHLDKLLPGAIVKNSDEDLSQLEDLDVGKWVLIKHHYPESGDHLLAFRVIEGWSGPRARKGIVEVIEGLKLAEPCSYTSFSRRG